MHRRLHRKLLIRMGPLVWRGLELPLKLPQPTQASVTNSGLSQMREDYYHHLRVTRD